MGMQKWACRAMDMSSNGHVDIEHVTRWACIQWTFEENRHVEKRTCRNMDM